MKSWVDWLVFVVEEKKREQAATINLIKERERRRTNQSSINQTLISWMKLKMIDELIVGRVTFILFADAINSTSFL